RCANDHEDDSPAAAIHGFDAVPALVDSRDGPDHAWHWRGHGLIARQLSYPGFYSSPLGYPHPACRGDSVREPAFLFPAAFSRHHVVSGALHRIRIRTIFLCTAVCAAARRLGDAVRGPLSDRLVWIAASFPHSSAQRYVVCGAAESAYGPRLRI